MSELDHDPDCRERLDAIWAKGRYTAAAEAFSSAERALTDAMNQRDAARALADELGHALKAVEMQWYIGSAWPMETVRAALAKWEASHAK